MNYVFQNELCADETKKSLFTPEFAVSANNTGEMRQIASNQPAGQLQLQPPFLALSDSAPHYHNFQQRQHQE